MKRGGAIVSVALAAGIILAGFVACEPVGPGHLLDLTSVQPDRINPAGSQKFSCSSGGACVTGDSTGKKTSGVIGSATGGSGVYGTSSNGAGVHGTSTSDGGAGVRGVATLYGVEGISEDTTGAYAGVFAVADKASTWIFEGYDTATGSTCTISPEAFLTCTGSIEVKSERLWHVTSGGQHVLAYASESTAQTLDDLGSARISSAASRTLRSTKRSPPQSIRAARSKSSSRR